MRAPRAWGVFRPLQLGPWFTLSSLWEMFVVYVISGRKKKRGSERERKGGKTGGERRRNLVPWLRSVRAPRAWGVFRPL